MALLVARHTINDRESDKLSELEQHWAKALAEAERRARATGRQDIAEYVALRSANDLVRSAAIDWLISTFTALAAEANRSGSSLQIEQQDGHRFRVGQATMIGRLLTLRLGVRAIKVEAGWPRTPPDGFVRGGGLACAHIRHLGKPNSSEELLLTQPRNKAPLWNVLEKSGARATLSEARIRKHFSELVKS